LKRVREGDPPVIARIEADRVVFDLRTVSPEHDEQLADRLLVALRA
jgi:seryl-tRNA(Sec) selenium transferase